MSFITVAISVIAGAVLSVLIDWLMKLWLPEKPEIKHRRAAFVAIFILVFIIVWSITSESSNPLESPTMTVVSQPNPGPTQSMAINSLTPLDTNLLLPTALEATSSPTPSFVSPNPHPDPNDYIDLFGVPMRLVPQGEFTMGSNNGSTPDQGPAHRVFVDTFYIDKYEVTNALYKKCVDAGICKPPVEFGSTSRPSYYDDPVYDHYPVIYVYWDMALQYCQWRGGRLPTEAEWEKAARGDDGRIYPWGNTAVDGQHVNYCDKNCYQTIPGNQNDDGYADTSPVGTYALGISPYGLYDMAGNVWEWMMDWYGVNYYSSLSGVTRNPQGPAATEYHVLRGGSWDNNADDIRTFARGWYNPRYFNMGMRCVRVNP